MHLTQPSFLISSFLAGALSAAVPAPDTHFSPNSLAKLSNPTIYSNSLSKRADPTIGEGIDTGDPYQGGRLDGTDATNGAFSEIYDLMSYAITTTTDAVNNAVFVKYFNPGDKDTVLAVFDRLLGGEGATGGAAEMENIKVTGGKVQSLVLAPAVLEGFDYANPTLILSGNAWWVLFPLFCSP